MTCSFCDRAGECVPLLVRAKPDNEVCICAACISVCAQICFQELLQERPQRLYTPSVTELPETAPNVPGEKEQP